MRARCCRWTTRSRSCRPIEIVARKLSVRDAEKLVARAQNNGRQSPLLRVKKDKPRDLVRLEEQLADALAAAVEIRVMRKTQRGEQGEIAIAFGSLDELNGLLEKLGATRALTPAPQRARLSDALRGAEAQPCLMRLTSARV